MNEDESMESLDFVEKLSALWHFALQAMQMIVHTHLGYSPVLDPTSLGTQKQFLNHVWDASKPNYTATKSLIRHSLISRLLHATAVIKGFHTWDELENWRPTCKEIKERAETIRDQFADFKAAEECKVQQDDWNAHSVYFICDALFFLEFDFGHWHFKVLDSITMHANKALEHAWFVNKTGEPGQWIPSDLYLEHLNFWVKHVFIAKGNGVTIKYIMKKGSASVEAFCQASHIIANCFGNPDKSRCHKEVVFLTNIRALFEELECLDSAVIDVQVQGIKIWNNGNFLHYIWLTTYDSNTKSYPIGNPAIKVKDNRNQEEESKEEEESREIECDHDHATCLDTDTAFDNAKDLVLDFTNLIDIEGELGGGNEFSNGQVVL
ncbi:hypothetical protein BT96DRAFT_997625 [Gymnopus androsaceus JB14]|uniref:DUF6589 domain-containing protein n=1 Tax=Gymnopus androsaceus JB14 TaxID=1447944 RepID=A0A6A4HE36_9AGAR|nr:hypothetical protein BT96DRAFT_997625 [Gymnopus androsaceus JB14]